MVMQHKFEIGDEYRFLDGTRAKVVYLGRTHVVWEVTKPVESAYYGLKMGENFSNQIDLQAKAPIVKIEPFFEEGKKYKNSNLYREGYDEFKVWRVCEHDGERVAFGRRKMGNRGDWDFMENFEGWVEISG
jgi:hypothetical protein